MSAARIAARGRHRPWCASRRPSVGPVGDAWRERYVFGASTFQRAHTVTRAEAECETEAEAIEGARLLVDTYAACVAFVLDRHTGVLKNWSVRGTDDVMALLAKETPPVSPWPGAFRLDAVPGRFEREASVAEGAGA